MDYPKYIVSEQSGEFISINRLNETVLDSREASKA